MPFHNSLFGSYWFYVCSNVQKIIPAIWSDSFWSSSDFPSRSIHNRNNFMQIYSKQSRAAYTYLSTNQVTMFLILEEECDLIGLPFVRQDTSWCDVLSHTEFINLSSFNYILQFHVCEFRLPLFCSTRRVVYISTPEAILF